MSANPEGGIGPLRERRKAAGLSQEQLARAADCSTAMVRLLEAGYRPMTHSDVLPRVAAVLTNEESPAGDRAPLKIASAGGDGAGTTG